MRVSIRRLKRRPEFLRVARGQRKSAKPGLVLQALPVVGAGDAPECGLGFTVTRKVGGAVTRNRARRRLRAAADAVMPAHAAPGRDYVLIGRAGTIRRPFEALKGDLEAALDRLGCYRPGDTDGAGA
jgi:ribonuclease P protein component